MVAEKPSVAKGIVENLARGIPVNKSIGRSKFNPIFEFPYPLQGDPSYLLRVTSVCGHVMGLRYPDECKNWQ